MTNPVSEPRAERAENRDPPSVSLQGELLLLLAQQARRIPLSVIVLSGLLAGLMLTHVPPIYPALWLALVCASAVVHARVITSLPADTSRTDDQKLTVAAWSFTLRGGVLACLFLFFPFVPLTTGAIITIFAVGVCASTLPATAGYPRVFLPYAAVLLGPMACAWALTPGLDTPLHVRLTFIGMAALYLVTLVGHAKGAYRVFSESYDIRWQRLDLNRQLRAALDAAETASAAKTRFLAAASHDLRQPIHALALFSGSLLLRPLDAGSAKIATQIDKAVVVLASQLDALLDISRLDAGVIKKFITAIDFQSLLEPLVNEFSLLSERKGLRLVLSGVDGIALRTDAVLFTQVLRNLLSNAIKYTESGQVELSVKRLAGVACVTVSDTGCGIPSNEQQRVFEEFYQLHNPERDRSKGLGLGLAIVRRLTDLLDLNLKLTSIVGRGSSFSVEVPLANAHDDPFSATALQSTSAVTPHRQVLVVDDEEAIRLGMQTLLEEMGFGVRTTSSIEEAMTSALQHPPSIVLADLRLRGEADGIQAIQALRTLWPKLPALLISGDTAPERLRRARDAGVELLHKPVDASRLREFILRALNEPVTVR